MVENLTHPGLTSGRNYGTLLAVYLAKIYLGYLMGTTVILGLFAYLMDSVELLRRVGGNGVKASTALQMSAIKLPSLMMDMLPFAVLLATMVVMVQLNKRQELVALRAAGLPARRFLLAPMIIVLLTGLAALFVFQPMAATMLKKYNHWEDTVFPDSTRGLVTAGGSIWIKQREEGHDFFIYGKTISPNGTDITGSTIFVFSPTGTFQARLDADQMHLQNGKWKLENVTMLNPRQEIVQESSLILPTKLTQATIQNSFNPPQTMSLWELSSFLETLRGSGLPSAQHEMIFQRLMALPAFLLAMFLLAVPFALRFARNLSLSSIIGTGLGMGFGFYLFSNMASTFGLAGRLDVTLAAWLPTLIASLIASGLIIQLREE